jgi:hypothetical protein
MRNILSGFGQSSVQFISRKSGPEHYHPRQSAAWEVRHFCGKRQWRE